MVSRTSASDILLACKSWEDLHAALAAASEGTKGEVFEALVKAYLRLDSKYDFKNVWNTHGEVPKAVLTKLNLFNRDVTGIDLVAETSEGNFWAVQAKYHQDEKWPLSRKEATGLIAGRNRAHGEFELGLICTTANGRSKHLTGEPALEYLMGDAWRGLDGAFFARLHEHLRGLAPAPPAEKTPRPHQQEALDGITAYFADHSRGKVVMPCATGKSLIGFWSAEKLGARRVLVAVPNLSLVRQLLKDWTEQSLAHGRRARWMVVCSDDSVAETSAARDLGVKVDTDPAEVAAWLEASREADFSVVFTTYQSGRVLGEAAKKAGVEFDLGIFDEAHRTAGREGAPFAYLLSDDNITIRRRAFFTATPRIFKGKDREDIISMDDPAIFGGEAFKMPFLAAMDRGIIPNLTIVALAVAEREVEQLLLDRRFVRLQAEHRDEVIRTEDLVAALALRKAMKQFGIHRTLGFHSSKPRCRLAGEIQNLVTELLPEYGPLDTFHVDGDMTSGERDSELRAFEASDHALLTNVRVFVEGVDSPSLGAVLFADPKQSHVEIVQGVGRALRPFAGKESGYAIIPTIIEDDGTPADKAFDQVVRIACALGSENEVILAYFAAVALGKPWAGRRVFEVSGDVDVGVKVDLDAINRAVAVRTYERTVEWRSFEDARAFARSLGIENQREWQAYSKSGHRPADIPVNPDRVYAHSGWDGYGDWLGTMVLGRGDQVFRPFIEAQAFVHTLGLKNAGDWYDYCGSGKKPEDIPAAARVVYKESGWTTFGDWLGTNRVADRDKTFLPFELARAFARSLELRTTREWQDYSKSGKRPNDIPGNPNKIYKGAGWAGIKDWLGIQKKVPAPKAPPAPPKVVRPFIQAREFARGLGFTKRSHWGEYAKSGQKPDDIPAKPDRVYREEWIDFSDWLGAKIVAPKARQYRPFPQAREFARGLGLKSAGEWVEYAKTPAKPDDIPAAPANVYELEGWDGFGDWLATERVADQEKEYRPFEEARAFARSLRLRNQPEWIAYAKSGAKPPDIPARPDNTYKNDGWLGYGDWLGNGNKWRGGKRKRNKR